MILTSQSIDRDRYTAPIGLGNFVKRFGVKGDAGIVSVVLLDPKLCQPSLTWQRIFENPTLKLNILQATMRPVQANRFNKLVADKLEKLLVPFVYKVVLQTCQAAKQGIASQCIAISQYCVPASFLKQLSVCCIFGHYVLKVFFQIPGMLDLYNSKYEKPGT